MHQPAAHRSIMIVDVENFGDPARTNAHQLAIRDGMYKVLRQSFARARISLRKCVVEDRGDGVLILVPPEVPKSWLVTRLPARLAAMLTQHNAMCPVQERIRLRMALDAGEVHRDAHGYTGVSLNRAFRLVEAPVSRATLRDSSGVVALIVSGWFYDEVVRHHAAAGPSRFRQVRVVIKEIDTAAWVRVLEPGDVLSWLDNGQPTPTLAGLVEGSQPVAPRPAAHAVVIRDQRLERPPGAWITRDPVGAEFTVFADDAEAVDLCLVDENGNEQRRIALSRLPAADGVWHVHVSGVGAGQRYGYRVTGPYMPSSGHRFNPHKLLLDPYAKAITGTVNWAGPVFGYRRSSDTVPDLRDTAPDPADSAPCVPHSVLVDDAFDWGNDKHPNIPWADMVIYEAHVRGFTKRHPLVPEEQRGTYAGMSSAPVVDYLRDLGITTLQLMPVHHFVSEQALIQQGLTNYWGYNSIGFFAPEAKYSSSGTVGGQVREFKAMVRDLHKAGIEVFLDVVFNHTAEGDHTGPHLCFRGIGNRTYYRLERDQSRYKDYACCGNSLNMPDPRVLAFIVGSLRYWVTEMHVDGFRFDLPSALAVNLYEAGCLNTFFELIRNDPVVSQVKLIAESWDLGESGGYQVDKFPRLWAEFNDRYRDSVCCFWRGAPQPLEELAHRLTGSVDLCRPDGPGPATSINFIAYHDGFTLNDLVSYNNKHNETNGEDNQDGIDFNNSWNCGAEGPTGDPEIRELRERQKRNFLTTLFLSAGVPMLQAGDELGRTQYGNNNPYCQDNEVSWVDWAPFERGDPLLQFVKDLIALRSRYRIFRRRKPYQGSVIRNTGMKDIGWFTSDGAEMDEENWAVQNISAFGMFLNGQAVFDRSMQGERKKNDSFLLLVNGGSETIRFALPGPRWVSWYVPIINTGDTPASADTATIPGLREGDAISLKARSVIVLKIQADQRLNQAVS
jgi:isoamylase